MKLRVAMFVSGKGTTLKYFLDQHPDTRNFEIVLVLADRPCRALRIAEAYGIPYMLVWRERFPRPSHREAFTAVLQGACRYHDIHLIVMAGFMTLLGKVIFRQYRWRILNSHPALPGMFPGKDAIGEAYAAWQAGQVDKTGCTIMFTDEGKDTGKTLAHGETAFQEGDTKESVRERVKRMEKPLYYAATCEAVEILKEW